MEERMDDFTLTIESNEMNARSLEPKYCQTEAAPRYNAYNEGEDGTLCVEGDQDDELPEDLAYANSEDDIRSCGSSRSEDTPRMPRVMLPGRNPSSTTLHTIYTTQSHTDSSKAKERRRPYLMNRLRSSSRRKPDFQPTDFQLSAEEPEKRFVDSIGMVLPGVNDRAQCTRLRAHVVSVFRLCEPIEYSTALADHGLTYTDYGQLIRLLFHVLNTRSTEETRRDSEGGHLESTKTPPATFRHKDEKKIRKCSQHEIHFDASEHIRRDTKQAIALNQLLEEVTSSLQDRGTPIMVSVNSYSIFAPTRISEAHVQILHVTPVDMEQQRSRPRTSPSLSIRTGRIGQRLSFMESLPLLPTEPQWPRSESMAMSTSKPRRTVSTDSDSARKPLHRSPNSQRDHSLPYPLWPNAIPSRKREVMHVSLDKYGVDPYFRAWMRANINSRTQSSTYQMYMIEKEDDPFVNTRLEYIDAALRKNLLLDVLINGNEALREQFPSAVNRGRYEHNRKLECRRITESGSRYRILRFAFRHPIYPPHTPEMEGLGLRREMYELIISDIDIIHNNLEISTKCPIAYARHSFDKIRRQSAKEALPELSKYLRRLNARHRHIVWTIEKIPCVYDRGFAKDRTEWEISAWDSRDPLELLIELETWGIVEKRLTLGSET
ncbi:hypothetical protein NX059_008475 [Plenodomus lindquistii]|nr:hypothetical protein NX059_008475 [Plenodomus lindquistii]